MDDSSFVRVKISELLYIVNELETKFPGRKFSIDGHLLGSIGEVLAEEYYNIKLYPNSTKTHDGEVDGKRVQIKITQGKTVNINDVPDYLLVLFLDKKDRSIYEVYNGPCEWLRSRKKTKNGWYSCSLKKLIEMDEQIFETDRIHSVKHVNKLNSSIQNK